MSFTYKLLDIKQMVLGEPKIGLCGQQWFRRLIFLMDAGIHPVALFYSSILNSDLN